MRTMIGIKSPPMTDFSAINRAFQGKERQQKHKPASHIGDMVDLTESKHQLAVEAPAKSLLPDLKGEKLDILVLSNPGDQLEGQVTLQLVKTDEPSPFASITAMFEKSKSPMKGNTHKNSP